MCEIGLYGIGDLESIKMKADFLKNVPLLDRGYSEMILFESSEMKNGLVKSLSAKSFAKDDFTDEASPLRIQMKFHLSEEEIGIE